MVLVDPGMQGDEAYKRIRVWLKVMQCYGNYVKALNAFDLSETQTSELMRTHRSGSSREESSMPRLITV